MSELHSVRTLLLEPYPTATRFVQFDVLKSLEGIGDCSVLVACSADDTLGELLQKLLTTDVEVIARSYCKILRPGCAAFAGLTLPDAHQRAHPFDSKWVLHLCSSQRRLLPLWLTVAEAVILSCTTPGCACRRDGQMHALANLAFCVRFENSSLFAYLPDRCVPMPGATTTIGLSQVGAAMLYLSPSQEICLFRGDMVKCTAWMRTWRRRFIELCLWVPDENPSGVRAQLHYRQCEGSPIRGSFDLTHESDVQPLSEANAYVGFDVLVRSEQGAYQKLRLAAEEFITAAECVSALRAVIEELRKRRKV